MPYVLMIYLFYFLSIIIALCFGAVVIYCFNTVVSLCFLPLSGNFLLFNMVFNIVTMLILLMLLICFLYVHRYTHHYFGGSYVGTELNKLICLFVGVMASLVCTSDYVMTLVFWEYLGVVSYFLILFYGSYLSLQSSVITLVSSRFGDVSLFVLVCLSCYIINSFLPVIIVFFFIIFTKSASFPFISWLLEAMRAPTPVSSLVHSSTLVAAGVWFAMRYDFIGHVNNSFFFSFMLLITIFITGLCCFFFIDLKKIVALSTCNNISWCILYLIFGDFLLSLFQLISHGVAKCMLFILIGDVMSGSSGSQLSNCVYNSKLYGNCGIFGLFSVVLGLAGAPFIGVFFTKHFLLTNFMGTNNLILFIFMLCCVFLSYFYSFRLCSILINTKSSIVTGVFYFFNSELMIYSWLFINYFIVLSLDEKAVLSLVIMICLLFFQFVACCTAYFFYNSTIFSNWSSSLFGCDNLVDLCYSLFVRMLKIVSVFFYRWDAYILSLFSNIGRNAIEAYTIKILNMIVIVIFLFLMCCSII